MSSIANAACAVALVGMSMVGLHHGVEYSGWVLFIGLLVAFGS